MITQQQQQQQQYSLTRAVPPSSFDDNGTFAPTDGLLSIFFFDASLSIGSRLFFPFSLLKRSFRNYVHIAPVDTTQEMMPVSNEAIICYGYVFGYFVFCFSLFSKSYCRPRHNTHARTIRQVNAQWFLINSLSTG